MSPGRKPSRSPASTAGRVRTIRFTSRRDSAATAIARARTDLPVPAGPIPTVIVSERMASTYRFWFTVLGATFRPRWRHTTSSRMRLGLSWRSSAPAIASMVPGAISWPWRTRSDSSRTTVRATPTSSSSPSSVSTLPRRYTSQSRCSSSVFMTRSPGPASSAATSLGSSSWIRTSGLSDEIAHALASDWAWLTSPVGESMPEHRRSRGAPSGAARRRQTWARSEGRPLGGQLLPHQGADPLAVGAALHLGHDQPHHLAHLARRAGARLGDGVADDGIELLVRELRRQVRGDDLGLALLGGRGIGAAAVAVGLGGLEAALVLTLEHLDLVAAIVLGRLLELGHDQTKRVHALALAGLHGVPRVPLHLLQQRHPPQV